METRIENDTAPTVVVLSVTVAENNGPASGAVYGSPPGSAFLIRGGQKGVFVQRSISTHDPPRRCRRAALREVENRRERGTAPTVVMLSVIVAGINGPASGAV